MPISTSSLADDKYVFPCTYDTEQPVYLAKYIVQSWMKHRKVGSDSRHRPFDSHIGVRYTQKIIIGSRTQTNLWHYDENERSSRSLQNRAQHFSLPQSPTDIIIHLYLIGSFLRRRSIYTLYHDKILYGIPASHCSERQHGLRCRRNLRNKLEDEDSGSSVEVDQAQRGPTEFCLQNACVAKLKRRGDCSGGKRCLAQDFCDPTDNICKLKKKSGTCSINEDYICKICVRGMYFSKHTCASDKDCSDGLTCRYPLQRAFSEQAVRSSLLFYAGLEAVFQGPGAMLSWETRDASLVFVCTDPSIVPRPPMDFSAVATRTASRAIVKLYSR